MNNDLYKFFMEKYSNEYDYNKHFEQYINDFFFRSYMLDIKKKEGVLYDVPGDRELKIGDIKKNIKYLIFNYDYKFSVEKGVIPKNITYILFNCKLNEPLVEGIIPDSVTHLFFGCLFDYKKYEFKKGIIPESVIYLGFEGNFNQPLEDIIPNNVKYLYLEYFNQPLNPGNIPNNLTHLIFGNNFDQPLTSGVLPHTLKYLKFGNNFDQPLNPGILPFGMTHLIFGQFYNQPLKINSIPNSVIYLIFSTRYNHPINNILPDKLIYLKLGMNFNQELKIGDIPNSVKYLKLGFGIEQSFLCNSLNCNSLNCNSLNCNSLNCNSKNIIKSIIPDSVTHLSIHYMNRSLQAFEIPNNVTHLYIDQSYLIEHSDNKHIIPSSITHLRLGNRMTLSNINVLNYDTMKFIQDKTNISHLSLRDSFYMTDNNYIPFNVKYLSLNENFNKKIKIGKNINNENEYFYIPDSVERLELGWKSGWNSDIKIDKNNLPKNLIELTIPNEKLYSDNDIDKNIFVSKLHYSAFSTYKYYISDIASNFIMKYKHYELLREKVENIKKKDLFGQIIYKELVEKVFNPNRLTKICDKYNVTFNDLIKIY